MKRVARISVAAAVLLGLTIALSHGLQRPLGGRIYAAELSAARKQVENARTADLEDRVEPTVCSRPASAGSSVNPVSRTWIKATFRQGPGTLPLR